MRKLYEELVPVEFDRYSVVFLSSPCYLYYRYVPRDTIERLWANK